MTAYSYHHLHLSTTYYLVLILLWNMWHRATETYIQILVYHINSIKKLTKKLTPFYGDGSESIMPE
jgi:hypothetical protein